MLARGRICKFHTQTELPYIILTLKTASIIRVTFSLTESLRMSARIGITLNLQQTTYLKTQANAINIFVQTSKFEMSKTFV